MIIYAINIHTGGGKVLLNELLTATPQADIEKIFIDARYTPPTQFPADKIITIRPTIFHRFLAEFRLKKSAKLTDKVLMFGNLPPVFKLNIKVILYLQNVLLLPKIELPRFDLKKKIKLLIERSWLQCFRQNVDEVWVQTNHVANLTKALYNEDKILIKPIIPADLRGPPIQRIDTEILYDFIYVASCDPHKNLERLVLAWQLLAEKNLRPKLLLVLTSNCKNIEKLVLKYHLESTILIMYNVPRNDLLNLYKKTSTLIYPSLLESYGLPLLEAHKLGLKIVASDLPYAKEFNFVDQYFDPYSEKGIAESIWKAI